MKLLADDIHNYLLLYDNHTRKALTDPNVIIQNVLTTMKTKLDEANATVNLPKLPDMLIDPLLFSQLITNLIGNAIKFRIKETDLVIKISLSKADELNILPTELKGNEYNIISIADNGTGFDNTDAGKIFDLFTQLHPDKYKGSGIGLAVCKKIMDIHGGFIIAKGQPMQGASFHCCFPVQH
jgi:signal transduction histidine kinase